MIKIPGYLHKCPACERYRLGPMVEDEWTDTLDNKLFREEHFDVQATYCPECLQQLKAIAEGEIK